MAGSLAPVMYWVVRTTICSALRSEVEQLPYQAVMQPVQQLSCFSHEVCTLNVNQPCQYEHTPGKERRVCACVVYRAPRSGAVDRYTTQLTGRAQPFALRGAERSPNRYLPHCRSSRKIRESGASSTGK